MVDGPGDDRAAAVVGREGAVGRVWAELVGEGCYERIDDIGPDRAATAQVTVGFPSRRFAQSGYDLKWPFRTIIVT